MPQRTLRTWMNSAVKAGMTAYTKSKSPKLVNARIDGESKEAILLPPEIKTVITRTQQLTEDLLEDTRQHYHQSLGITYHASAE